MSLTLSIVDELINDELLLQRAKQLGLEATDGEVEDKFTEVKSPFTEEQFQRQLKDRGVTVDDLKQDIRRQISLDKLLNREVVAKISITDQDVSELLQREPRAIQRRRDAIPHRPDRGHASQGPANPQPQE